MQTRNVGIDAARAVALVAMMVAHLTVQEGITAQVLFGFPAALFAFIAGVSMGYMRAQPAEFIVRGSGDAVTGVFTATNMRSRARAATASRARSPSSGQLMDVSKRTLMLRKVWVR